MWRWNKKTERVGRGVNVNKISDSKWERINKRPYNNETLGLTNFHKNLVKISKEEENLLKKIIFLVFFL